MRTKPMTVTMIECVTEMEDCGGEFVRFQGGYWAPSSVERRAHDGKPIWSFGSSTVDGVVLRGHATYIEWKDGRKGRFPIAVRVTPHQSPAKDTRP